MKTSCISAPAEAASAHLSTLNATTPQRQHSAPIFEAKSKKNDSAQRCCSHLVVTIQSSRRNCSRWSLRHLKAQRRADDNTASAVVHRCCQRSNTACGTTAKREPVHCASHINNQSNFGREEPGSDNDPPLPHKTTRSRPAKRCASNLRSRASRSGI